MIRPTCFPPVFSCAALTLLTFFLAGKTASVAEDLRPGFVGEYFDIQGINPIPDDVPADLVPAVIRLDRQINFAATNGEFHGTKLKDNLYARWTGRLRIPKDGTYKLWLISDDGSRLFLNNESVIDNWGNHAMTRQEVSRELKAGDYHVRILYCEGGSEAGCIFGWDLPEGKSEPVPAGNLFHEPANLAQAQNRKTFVEKASDQPKAGVDQEGEGRRFGLLFLEGDKIVIGQSNGEKIHIDPTNVTRIEFNNPEWDRTPTPEEPKPQPTGPLGSPWKHATVGRLVSGSSAHGNDGNFQVFTSARHPESKFADFSMAYRPAPAIGHLTVRVTKIENTSWDSVAGIILRDGTNAESGNVLLSMRPSGGVSMRSWQTQGGSTRSDSRGEVRPPYWLRLIRDGKNVTGLTSPDGRAWRKLWEIPEKFDGKTRIFGLVAAGKEGNTPWAATFENVSVGTLEQADAATTADPRTYLTDGSVIRGPVTSNEAGTLIEFGKPWNRTVPALYVARIDFFHPMSTEVEERLSKMRPGVLLTIGDFIEAKFDHLEPEKLAATSALFGKKEYRPGTEADSIILNEIDPARALRANFIVETWDGQIFAARGFSISGGKFVFDAPALGTPVFPPDKIRRIAPPEAP